MGWESQRKNVLLAVTGLTPQVLTETLFALSREPGPSALPQRIYVVTTAEGARRAQLMLLSEQPGWFHRLRRDWGLPSMDFSEEHIHVLRDANGNPMDDVRSGADNAAAADQIAELVRRLTEDPDTALHVSLAGGRKTLGFFAGYALSLWGRPQDRLSHVLVSEPFESCWEFFYPTPDERILTIEGKGVYDCRTAQVTLADIPFVRLRSGLPPALLQSSASFAQAVAAAQGYLGSPSLTLNLNQRFIVAHGQKVSLPPAELAFLAWFARRRQLNLPPLPRPSDGVPEREYAHAYQEEYQRIVGPLGDDERVRRRLRNGMSRADFDERKARLKNLLQRSLGAAAQPYLIQGRGPRPQRFELPLPPQAIRFES
ncbi:MAG: CRISPR-associated ring nuclease Csm6 [Tepidimonas sp.]|uniref:CRISPR-associated ring nuclease Csm6 n=1 Tax=Tepidimonas sp. TaxID=2002775 RepID=UPI00298F1EA8|nr:CRISPR-associated ring nuclease Csm6 [Tepidimonas sp.]MDW8336753.1 CRISPR-associated ring nuclease Csm6 [Tepidimonas sp.]